MAANEATKPGTAARIADAALGPQPPPQKMITATVRPGGRYTMVVAGERKSYGGGDVVEVTERNYQAARMTLVTEADAAGEKVAAEVAAKPADTTALFRAFRHRSRAANVQKKEAADVRHAEEIARVLRAAGLKVVPA